MFACRDASGNRARAIADSSSRAIPTCRSRRRARRRDFTINAILKDPLTGEIVDPFDGQGDIERQLLRMVSREHLREDSLRVLRAAQFAARFEFEVDAETVEVC